MPGDYSRLIAWPFLRHLIGRSQDRRATPLRSSAATSDKHRGLGAAQHPVPGQTGLEFAHWCYMRWEDESRSRLRRQANERTDNGGAPGLFTSLGLWGSMSASCPHQRDRCGVGAAQRGSRAVGRTRPTGGQSWCSRRRGRPPRQQTRNAAGWPVMVWSCVQCALSFAEPEELGALVEQVRVAGVEAPGSGLPSSVISGGGGR